MKRVIILGDGMADEPIEELGGKTPLQYAETPTFDWLAKHSRLGMLKTVPAHQTVECFLHESFALGVESGSCFVED